MPLEELKQQARSQSAATKPIAADTSKFSRQSEGGSVGSSTGTTSSSTQLPAGRGKGTDGESGEAGVVLEQGERQQEDQKQLQQKQEQQQPPDLQQTKDPSSRTTLGEEDLVVKGLLQWFKHRFFKWVSDLSRDLSGSCYPDSGSCGIQ